MSDSFRRSTYSSVLILLLALFSASSLNGETSLHLPETAFPELTDILQRMEEESPEMLIQRARVQAAEADEHARLAQKWPQLRMNLQLANRSEFRDGDPEFQNTTQPFGIARLEQELYHWGSLDAWRDIGKFRKSIEENNYNETYRLLVLRVRTLYLRLLFAREQIGYYQAEVSRLQQNLSSSMQQADAGRITSDDLELERLAVEEAQIALERAQDESDMLEEDLRLASGWQAPILGIDQDLLLRLNQMERAEQSSSEIIATAAAPPSAEYLNKQEELNIEEADFVRIRAKNLPLFDLVAEAYQDQIATQGLDNVDRTVFTVYLRVNWHIFDGFETQWQKIQSKAKQRALQDEAEHIAAKDRLEVERLQRNRKMLQRDIRLWERRVAISENTMERIETEVEKDTATEAELLTARNELLADSLTLASYRLDLLGNSSELLSIYGRDPFATPKHPLEKPVNEVYPENFYW